MSSYSTSVTGGVMTVTIPNVNRDQLPPFDLSAALALVAVTTSVIFKDSDANEVNMNRLNCSSNASVVSRRAGVAAADARTHYLIKGGWHPHTACEFYVSGTTASAGILVEIEI